MSTPLIVLLAVTVFVAGIAVGVIAMVSYAVRGHPLLKNGGHPRSRVSRGARRVNGLWLRSQR
jgi:hypothetical protein